MTVDGRAGAGFHHRPLDRRRDAVVAGVLVVVVLIVFGTRLHHTIVAGVVDNVVFGADPGARLQALATARYWRMGYELHPLACLWTLLTAGPLRLAGMPTADAAAFSLALALGAGAAALFGALRLGGTPRRGAVAVIALILASFSVSTGFSVVDTYAISFAAVSGAVFTVMAIPQRWPITSYRAILLAGIALAMPAAANLPTAAHAAVFAGIVWDRTHRWRPTLAAGGAAAAIAGGAAAAWLLVTRLVFHYDSGRVIDAYASWSHFTGPELLDGLAGLFGFALVSPPGDLRCRYLAETLAGYGGGRAMLLGGWWLAIGAGLWASARDREHRGLVLAASIAAAAMLAFYLYFAPQVMLLYAPQFMPALALLLAAPVRRHPGAWLPLAVLAAATAAVNAPVLWTVDLTDFAASCPPALQVNGAL